MTDIETLEATAQVKLPSGADFWVYPEEVDYFTERVRRYGDEHIFVLISDQQDMDRLLIQELMIYRWGRWIVAERNYFGEALDPEPIQKQLTNASAEIRQLKKQLGLDSVTRQKTAGRDSIPAYLDNLRQRAKEFCIVRNEMAVKSITLFAQMESLIVLFHNCTPDEREEMHVTKDDIFEWINEVAIPEYKAIDDAFRERQQYWISEL